MESALIEHPAVVETAVIGKPDPERTELIKAFVVLDPAQRAPAPSWPRNCACMCAIARQPRLPARNRFVAELPKTPSGKVQRFILRNESGRQRDAQG